MLPYNIRMLIEIAWEEPVGYNAYTLWVFFVCAIALLLCLSACVVVCVKLLYKASQNRVNASYGLPEFYTVSTALVVCGVMGCLIGTFTTVHFFLDNFSTVQGMNSFYGVSWREVLLSVYLVTTLDAIPTVLLYVGVIDYISAGITLIRSTNSLPDSENVSKLETKNTKQRSNLVR